MVNTKTEEFLKNRLIWQAKQHGVPSEHANFFDNLSQDIQDYLNSLIRREQSGSPVLFFTKPTKEWTLVCAYQVVVFNNQNTICINVSDIGKILPTAFDPARLQKIDIATIKKKAEWDTIKVIDKQENCYILHANKGSDLFALWNTLLMHRRLKS